MLLALLVACGDTQPHAVAAPPAPASAPKAEAPAPAPRPTFQCCDTPEASAILESYVAVNAALAADSSAALPLGALAAASATPLPAVSQALAPLASADIAGQRTGLNGQSGAIVAYLRAHKGGSAVVAEAFCPMANASWVQAGETVANPYYGSEMLTCGYFKE